MELKGEKKNKGRWRVKKRINFCHADSDFITCIVHRKFSNFASTIQASCELITGNLIQCSSVGASFKVWNDTMMRLFIICFVAAQLVWFCHSKRVQVCLGLASIFSSLSFFEKRIAISYTVCFSASVLHMVSICDHNSSQISIPPFY